MQQTQRFIPKELPLQVPQFVDLWHRNFSQTQEGKQYPAVLLTALEAEASGPLPSFGDAALALNCLLQVETVRVKPTF